MPPFDPFSRMFSKWINPYEKNRLINHLADALTKVLINKLIVNSDSATIDKALSDFEKTVKEQSDAAFIQAEYQGHTPDAEWKHVIQEGIDEVKNMVRKVYAEG